MNSGLVECIPNFSEGRRMKVVDQIIREMELVSEVKVLDRHSDADHNRTVVTLLGTPDAVKEAAFQGIKKAAELIDMDAHEGAHPRIGAADVVPFVPIKNITMQDCVQLTHSLGKRVGDELGIPVYLYENAASSPERVNLENIRKGEYEGLKEEIGKNPERKPDYGPLKLGKAGAVVIGARAPLIAFNVYLAIDDLSIAKQIARTIRHSSGGLRFVKAMGVLVGGLAQVSMNLTDFRKTAIPQVMEMIRREAKRYGTTVHHSELVGLTPQKALIDTAVWYTQLDQFSQGQILENKLGESNEDAQQTFLDALASDDPTPGGGSAAAFTAAEAAALISMVARLTIAKKKYVQYKEEFSRILSESEKIRLVLMTLVETDALAFKAVIRAYRLPRSDESQSSHRKKMIAEALLEAARIPLQTVAKAEEILKLSISAVGICNINAITDLATAAQLARAVASAAGANVRVNLQDLDNTGDAKQLLKTLTGLEKSITALDTDFRKRFLERSKYSLL